MVGAGPVKGFVNESVWNWRIDIFLKPKNKKEEEKIVVAVISKLGFTVILFYISMTMNGLGVGNGRREEKDQWSLWFVWTTLSAD